MKVKITKPDSTLYDGDSQLLQLPGTDGKFEVLPGHAPLVASLGAGSVRLIDAEGAEQLYDIRGGVVKVHHDEILILVQ